MINIMTNISDGGGGTRWVIFFNLGQREEPETKKSKTKTNNNVFTNNKPKDSFSHAKRKHGMQDITEMSLSRLI